jgi:acetylornithine/N-succinyldiaminopimelate aminotransferase
MVLHAGILPVYRRADIVMQRGEGVYLYDNENHKYLDFSAGIAVNALGHNHPKVTKALQKQSKALWHCSNLFHNEPLIQFAEKLIHASFADSIFCCSSGAEAVESAIKFIRRYHYKNDAPQRTRIIVAENAFHGRTMMPLSACQNPRATEGYGPLNDCFDHVAFDDADALEQAITPETAAIMLEPVQGEGGIHPLSKAYLQRARELCTEHGILLFLDEVQCGMGRTGTLFAYEQYGILPDLVTIGKGIGNGFPLAACLVTQKIADVMEPGCHGSTYGSNPLSMAVGNAVLDVLMDEALLHNVRTQGEQLQSGLASLVEKFPQRLEQVRGVGLMVGLSVHVSAHELSAALRQNGLITAPAGDRVLRFIPPLIVESKHVEQALTIVEETLQAW